MTYAWRRGVPRTASAGKRAVAFLIDAAIVFGLAWTITFLLAALGLLRIPDVELVPGQRSEVAGLMWLVSIIELPLLLLYFTLLEGTLGRTVGKTMLGLRVARVDDARMDVAHSFLRNLLRLLWVTPFAPLVVVMVALDAWSLSATELDQRMGDLAAGTVVLDERLVV